MGRLLRRVVPLAALLAWRNRDQLADWYRKRTQPDEDDASIPRTQIAPIPDGETGADSKE